jgi:adenylate cyclase
MWPFKRWRERAEVRAAFMKYLSPELVDRLSRNPDRVRLEVARADICFILLQVRDDPVDQVSAHIAHAMDIIIQCDGTVCDIMSSMVLAIFGLPLREDPEKSSDQRAKSVARLVTELGTNIRLVYGTTEGLVGNYGSSDRFHWGPLLPGFARYMTALMALEFGQSAEIRPT